MIQETTAGLERRWARELGEDVYAGLARALDRLQDLLERDLMSRS